MISEKLFSSDFLFPCVAAFISDEDLCQMLLTCQRAKREIETCPNTQIRLLNRRLRHAENILKIVELDPLYVFKAKNQPDVISVAPFLMSLPIRMVSGSFWMQRTIDNSFELILNRKTSGFSVPMGSEWMAWLGSRAPIPFWASFLGGKTKSAWKNPKKNSEKLSKPLLLSKKLKKTKQMENHPWMMIITCRWVSAMKLGQCDWTQPTLDDEPLRERNQIHNTKLRWKLLDVRRWLDFVIIPWIFQKNRPNSEGNEQETPKN